MENLLLLPLKERQIGIPISSVSQIIDYDMAILHLPDIHPLIEGIAIIKDKSAGLIRLSKIVGEKCKEDCCVEIYHEGETLFLLTPLPLILQDFDLCSVPLKEGNPIFSKVLEGAGLPIYVIDIRGLYKSLSLL